MIIQANPAVAQLVATAAAAAAATLASSEPLTPGAATRDAELIATGSHAVLAQFTGSYSGDLLIVVDDELVAALAEVGLAETDLGAALAPTLAAVASAVGSIVLAPAQVTDARLGIGRVLANPQATVVPLTGASGVRAAVGIALTATPAEPVGPATAGSGSGSDERQAQRLDLLRGVEMEATAELGRARLTVNDLLGLRSGAVLELDRGAGGPADLFVNGRLIARGEVVVVDENYGLRITQVVADTPGR